MTTLEEFSKIIEIDCLKQYILIKNNGIILANTMAKAKNIVDFVLACGDNCRALTNYRVMFFMFPRDNHENFFIFSLGKYYLGVVKNQGADDGMLVKKVLTFINDLSNKDC